MSYEKLKSHKGIYKNTKSKRYLARKKVDGKNQSETFDTIYEAKQWIEGKVFSITISPFATLKEVWETMQREHFKTLSESTRQIWIRRYKPLEQLEHLQMDKITPSTITKWIERNVEYYRSEKYTEESRGRASRCNLDNEINLFVTIFNWYKASEEYQYEAVNLPNPILRHHKRLGFIRVKPVNVKTFSFEDALRFFSFLNPPYRGLAMIQFFTASRIGEASAIHFKNIDRDAKVLTILETSCWDMNTKRFLKFNPHPKNKTPRLCSITPEIDAIIEEYSRYKVEGCDLMFHIQGLPLNYQDVQVKYRAAQKKAKLKVRGTHILRHGMAKLARKYGGGLDAVIAMTGHKDIKLADHYSKNTFEDTQEVSEKVMKKFREVQQSAFDNVESLENFSSNVIKLSKTVPLGAIEEKPQKINQ